MKMIKTLLTILAIILGLGMSASQLPPRGMTARQPPPRGISVSKFGIEKNYLINLNTHTNKSI